MGTITNLEAIQAVLASERVLDEPVGEYRPRTMGAVLDLGTASTFKEYYSKNLLSVPGKVVIGSAEIATAPEVTAVLRALLYTGCCRIEERSSACRDVFMRACGAGAYIGVNELLGTFVEKPENPFVKVLQDTIKKLVGES